MHARELLGRLRPVHVGLDKDQRRARLDRADVDLERVDRLGELRHGQRRVELDLGRDDDLVGTELLGAEVDAASSRSGLSSIASRIAATTFGPRRLRR